MSDYQKDEKIEVLTPEGKVFPGKYVCLSSRFNDDIGEHYHIIECFDLDYCYIRIPNSKIRKVISNE